MLRNHLLTQQDTIEELLEPQIFVAIKLSCFFTFQVQHCLVLGVMLEYNVNASALLCGETTLCTQDLAVRRILSLVASATADMDYFLCERERGGWHSASKCWTCSCLYICLDFKVCTTQNRALHEFT